MCSAECSLCGYSAISECAYSRCCPFYAHPFVSMHLPLLLLLAWNRGFVTHFLSLLHVLFYMHALIWRSVQIFAIPAKVNILISNIIILNGMACCFHDSIKSQKISIQNI